MPTSQYRSESVGPGPALVGSAEAGAAEADGLAVHVAVAPGGHALALAADADDRRGRSDQDQVGAVGRNAANQGCLVQRLELAEWVSGVVGRFNDVDREVAVCFPAVVSNLYVNDSARNWEQGRRGKFSGLGAYTYWSYGRCRRRGRRESTVSGRRGR